MVRKEESEVCEEDGVRLEDRGRTTGVDVSFVDREAAFEDFFRLDVVCGLLSLR